MVDPFDLLHDQLVTAAARTQALPAPAAAPRVRARRWGRGAVPLVAALALAAGGATAAVVSLTRESSAPATGTLTEPVGAGLPAASTYSVTVSAGLTAGQAGWCTTLALRGTRDPASGAGAESCRAAGPGAALIGAGTLLSADGGGWPLSYAVVTDAVAAVRVGDREIATRRDPSVPAAWRVAVWTSASAAAAATVPTLVGPDGATVPQDGGGAPAASASRAGGAGASAGASCDIAARAGSGLTVGAERVATVPASFLKSRGTAFFPCASAVVHAGGQRYTTAILLASTRRPDAPPARHGDVLLRLRIGAWLVVRGPDNAAARRLAAKLRTRTTGP